MHVVFFKKKTNFSGGLKMAHFPENNKSRDGSFFGGEIRNGRRESEKNGSRALGFFSKKFDVNGTFPLFKKNSAGTLRIFKQTPRFFFGVP